MDKCGLLLRLNQLTMFINNFFMILRLQKKWDLKEDL